MHQKVVLIHIPKTAGSSLRAVLAHSMGTVRGATYKLIAINVPDASPSYYEGMASHAATVLPRLFEDGPQLMSGHYRYRDIAPVLAAQRNRVSLISFLRDPIKRTLSDYYYSISPRHAGHASFQDTYPTFEDYTRNAGEMNKQVDYLRPFDDAPLDITIESTLHNLDFIGLTESFQEDSNQLAAGLGIKIKKKFSENVNPKQDAMAQAYDTYHDMLLEVLAPDIALYKAVLERRRFPR